MYLWGDAQERSCSSKALSIQPCWLLVFQFNLEKRLQSLISFHELSENPALRISSLRSPTEEVF